MLLILAQHPTATRVAGFRQWQERGRQVRKGEKAIRIYGYSNRTVTETDTATGEETTRKIPTYPILSVFAEDQTDPIDGTDTDAHLCQLLTGDDPGRIYDRTAAALTARGWSVERADIEDSNGYTTIDGTHRVVVDARLEPAQAAKTALHEAGHVILHAEPLDNNNPDDPSRVAATEALAHSGIRETEAESVAYILAGIAGLDTSAYSIGYIAEWSNCDPDLLTATADRVLSAVRELADAIGLDDQDETAA